MALKRQKKTWFFLLSLLFSSWFCPTLCNPMDCSLPGHPVLENLPEFAQIHVRWIVDTVLPSRCSLAPPFLLFLIYPSIRVFSYKLVLRNRWPKLLELQLQQQSWINNIEGWFPIELTGFISLLRKRLSRVFSSTTNRKYQFFGTESSLWSNTHICTWLLKKP